MKINFVNIQGWMYDIGCDNLREIVAYAAIFGFSQDGESKFQGSLKYMAQICKCTKPTVIDTLNSLEQKGLIQKEQIVIQGVTFNRYSVILQVVKNLYHPSKEILPNNKYNNKESSKEDFVSSNDDTLGRNNNIYIEENNNSNTTPYNPPSSQELALFEGEDVQPVTSNTPKQYTWLIEFWNKETAGSFKPITSIQGKRLDSVRARLKEYGSEQFKNAIIRATQSDFLKGAGRQGFVASFDWIIKPNNFPKVLEGNYDNNNLTTQTTNDYAKQSFDRELARQQGQIAARYATRRAVLDAAIKSIYAEQGVNPDN